MKSTVFIKLIILSFILLWTNSFDPVQKCFLVAWNESSHFLEFTRWLLWAPDKKKKATL